MTKRLITGTANERGRRIFVQPADGSMKLVSYGRIRLDKIEPKIRFSCGVVASGLPSQCFDSRGIPELRLAHGGTPRSRRSQVGNCAGGPSLWVESLAVNIWGFPLCQVCSEERLSRTWF